jgi:hypothetical protein
VLATGDDFGKVREQMMMMMMMMMMMIDQALPQDLPA